MIRTHMAFRVSKGSFKMKPFKLKPEPEKLEDRKHGPWYLCGLCNNPYRCYRGKIECSCREKEKHGKTY